MYNSVTRHLCIVLCVHHPKWSLLPSLFVPPLPSSTSLTAFPLVITILLSVSVRFYFFCLIPSPFLPSPPKPPASDSCQPVLCVCESVSILVVGLVCSQIPRITEIMWYLPFCDWLTSLSLMLSGSIMLSQTVRVPLFFYGRIVFLCVNVPQLFYPHITGGHLGCFQILASLNSTAINIGVHIFFQISVSGFFR